MFIIIPACRRYVDWGHPLGSTQEDNIGICPCHLFSIVILVTIFWDLRSSPVSLRWFRCLILGWLQWARGWIWGWACRVLVRYIIQVCFIGSQVYSYKLIRTGLQALTWRCTHNYCVNGCAHAALAAAHPTRHHALSHPSACPRICTRGSTSNDEGRDVKLGGGVQCGSEQPGEAEEG